jgi:hypothetical protein
MDTVLISVTLISLGLAGAMGVLVAKLLREERKRSDARVAVLDELAAEPAPAHSVSWTVRQAPAGAVRIRREPEVRELSGEPQTRKREPHVQARERQIREREPHVQARERQIREREPQVRERERLINDLEIRPAVAEIFAEPERSSPWGRRFAVIGLLMLFGGAVLVTVALRRVGPEVSATKTPSAPGATPTAVAPLDLVSLRHTHDEGTLTITGLVQNPKTGAPVSRLTATAVVFAPDGTFLAGGKAPLDYTSLAAGDESPFVVTVPVRGSVARYRVGFRAEDGSVVAHVDRRTGDVARRAP